MATIRKRQGKYQALIRRTGYPPLTRTFTLLKDAQEWARMIERQADRHELVDRRCLDRITLRQLVERYRDSVAAHLRAGNKETVILNAFLRHPICDKYLSKLTTADFAAYRDARLREVAPQTIKRQLVPISRMFRLAVREWGIPLKENPLASLSLKATDNRRERRLRAGEYERLVAAAAVNRKHLTIPVVRLALETAMRRGELLALNWSHVDLERRTITIIEAKNGYSRLIPITDGAMHVLGQLRQADDNPKGRVIGLSENAFRLSWQRLVRRAALEDLHFHDLRHEAISRLFERGLTPPEVASISGHRTLSQLSRYAHASNINVRIKLGIPDQRVEQRDI